MIFFFFYKKDFTIAMLLIKLSPQDNSRKEWAFQKAITIQTYCNYHPVPVPFNIISIPAMFFYGCIKKRVDEADDVDGADSNSFEKFMVKC